MSKEEKPKQKIHPLLINSFNFVMFQLTCDIAVLYYMWKHYKDFMLTHQWINWFIGSFIVLEWFLGVILCIGYMIAINYKQVYIVETKETNKNNNEKK